MRPKQKNESGTFVNELAFVLSARCCGKMCNRYGHWATLAALRARAKQLSLELVVDREMGNLQPQANIYADQDGPILVRRDDSLVLSEARWGLPPFRERDAKGRLERPRNNIRQVQFWRQRYPDVILRSEHRCLVPFSAFAEPTIDSTWFTVAGEEVAFFAGVWMEWSGERLKAQPGKTRRKREHDEWKLFAFLTTEANDVVKPIHPDAMPVILTSPNDCLHWLEGGEASLSLQRPLPEEHLIVAELKADG